MRRGKHDISVLTGVRRARVKVETDREQITPLLTIGKNLGCCVFAGEWNGLPHYTWAQPVERHGNIQLPLLGLDCL
jgi:hypothetical protein